MKLIKYKYKYKEEIHTHIYIYLQTPSLPFQFLLFLKPLLYLIEVCGNWGKQKESKSTIYKIIPILIPIIISIIIIIIIPIIIPIHGNNYSGMKSYDLFYFFFLSPQNNQSINQSKYRFMILLLFIPPSSCMSKKTNS